MAAVVECEGLSKYYGKSRGIIKYCRPAELTEKGTMPTEAWFVLGGLSIITLVASVFVFSRRDVT